MNHPLYNKLHLGAVSPLKGNDGPSVRYISLKFVKQAQRQKVHHIFMVDELRTDKLRINQKIYVQPVPRRSEPVCLPFINKQQVTLFHLVFDPVDFVNTRAGKRIDKLNKVVRVQNGIKRQAVCEDINIFIRLRKIT